MTICLGSTRGTVPFLQQETPAVKHLPHSMCAAHQLFFWGPSCCWKQIILTELCDQSTTRDQEKFSGKVERGLAEYRDKDQYSTFPLSLQQDELVLLKWEHECDVLVSTTIPTPSSSNLLFLPFPWIWTMQQRVYFLYLYLKTGWLLSMLLLILCNHTTKLVSTAMSCSPGSGVSKAYRIQWRRARFV